MKKIGLSVFLVIALSMAGYLVYSLAKNLEEEKKSIKALFDTDESKQVDLLKLQQDIEAINLKGKKTIEELAQREKELAYKDKAADQLIKKLNAEHGVADAEFKERYSKVFEKFKNNQSAK